MAQSRLEKIGTIFTRVTGLLRAGAMKPEDKPLWYDIYAAFPPKLEPRFDRPTPSIPLKKIFYEEDVIRAKYHKVKSGETMNLSDTKYPTQTQQFLEIYKNLQDQGALDDEKIFETAQSMVKDKVQQQYDSKKEISETPSLLKNFMEAQDLSSIDVKDLFKEGK